MQALGHTGQLQPMINMVHEAWQPGASPEPSAHACNAALAACARANNLTAALSIKRRMVSLDHRAVYVLADDCSAECLLLMKSALAVGIGCAVKL